MTGFHLQKTSIEGKVIYLSSLFFEIYSHCVDIYIYVNKYIYTIIISIGIIRIIIILANDETHISWMGYLEMQSCILPAIKHSGKIHHSCLFPET